MSADLALLDRARQALAEARAVPELAELRDQAAAMARYLARKCGAEEAARHATEIRLRAERRIGEMLAETVQPGGSPEALSSGSTKLPSTVTRDQSSKWQRIASLPEPVFEEALAKPEPTTAALVKLARQLAAQNPSAPEGEPETNTTTALEALSASGRKFGTIYADPPWKYGNQGTRAATNNHYGTMSVDEIAALPIADLAADDAHLHLWTTNAFLFDAKAIIEAWGFEYKSCLVWVKPQMGIGNYWRVSHEFLLLGVRGRCPFGARDLMSWVHAERNKHSAKPGTVRAMIERASPAPRLELFGRHVAQGWTVWGNEIARGLFDEDVPDLDDELHAAAAG